MVHRDTKILLLFEEFCTVSAVWTNWHLHTPFLVGCSYFEVLNDKLTVILFSKMDRE